VPGARTGMVESNLCATLPLLIGFTREWPWKVRNEVFSLNLSSYLLYVYYWTNDGTLANGGFRDLIPGSE